VKLKNCQTGEAPIGLLNNNKGYYYTPFDQDDALQQNM
jgi:hypothetical protein